MNRSVPAHGGAGRPVYLVVSIDTECDKGPDWKTQHPLRFRSVLDGIPRRLMPLFRHYGIRPTFLLSPEILRDPACVTALSALEQCELGTHLHGEFIEPEADLEAAVTSTPQSAYPPSIERAKLENLTNLFRDRLGRPPVSFRGGRFALGHHTLGVLEELGYRVDSTVTPFRTNTYASGLQCNYWGAPLAPYHPSARDPRRPGDLKLLEVPVTILVPGLSRFPLALLRRMSDRTLRRKTVRRLLGAGDRKLWLRPLRGSADEVVSWSEEIIDSWVGAQPVVLNVMFHSVEVTAGASPYTQSEADVDALLAGMERLFGSLMRRGAVPVTLGMLAEAWTA